MAIKFPLWLQGFRLDQGFSTSAPLTFWPENSVYEAVPTEDVGSTVPEL